MKFMTLQNNFRFDTYRKIHEVGFRVIYKRVVRCTDPESGKYAESSLERSDYLNRLRAQELLTKKLRALNND